MELLICQHDRTRLRSDARDYLSIPLGGENGGNVATSTSCYHGNDNEDDDDDDGDDDGYDDDDEYSALEAACRTSPEQENTSDENYGPYNLHTIPAGLTVRSVLYYFYS